MKGNTLRSKLHRRLAGWGTLLAIAALARSAQAAPQVIDLLFQGGTVVTVDAERRVIPDGAVAVDRGRIVGVGVNAELRARFTPRRVVDAHGTIVMPGLVNAHTHAPMVLLRGMADDLKLKEWLEGHIFPAEKAGVTAEFVSVGTRLAALEMLLSGTTTFADMYYFEEQVAEAAREAGLRCVAGETLIEFPAPDNASVAEALAYSERFLKHFEGDRLVTAAVAPHSVYLAGPETWRAVRSLADRFQAPILTHLSETREEQEQIHQRYGKTPTELLADLDVLRPGLAVAHGVWLSASDRATLKAKGVGVVHCPQSNMKLASGAAPVQAMLAEKLLLGLGTDGAASNNDLDMFEEMLTAALLAKHTTGDPTAAPAAAVLEMATLGGARALGLADRIGSIEVGKRADLIVVSLSAPRLHPLFDPVSHLVYAVKGADVRDVCVDGELVVRDRQVLRLDAARVVAAAERAKADLVRRLLPTRTQGR